MLCLVIQMKTVYGYIRFLYYFSDGPEIFQMALCMSLSETLSLKSQHQSPLLSYIYGLGFEFPTEHFRFRAAVVIAFSNCSSNLIVLGRNQPRFLIMAVALTCVLVLLCFQNSPGHSLILFSDQSSE